MDLDLTDEEDELFTDMKRWATIATKMVSDWKKMAEELMAHAEELRIARAEKAPARTEESEDGQCIVGSAAKRKVPGAVPCPRKVACAGPVHPPAGDFTAEDVDASGESEVELIEAPAPRVVQPVKALPVRVVPERVCVNEGRVQHLEEQLVHACAENEELRAANVRYVKCLLNVRQHSCMHEAEFLQMSNKLYSMADN
ncbi:hypothetical protein BDR05DRAFT_945665 [Suillus weaverae]|nr:hypothetical protein BDR05DRAFT_945665 [Suillus weaverae]